MKRLLYKLTGGRPMEHVEFCFIDAISGEMVGRYTDAFGRFWLATSRWSLFRVPTGNRRIP